MEAESRRVVLHPTTPWLLRPFDRIPLAPIWVGTGIGLAFYLTLGLGSWVGAAMVERLLESALR